MAALFTVTQQLSESVQVWAGRLNAFLTSLGACSVQDLDIINRDNQSRAQLVATLTYQSPGSSLISAQAFVGDGTNPAQTFANAFLAANPTYRVLFLRDISDPQHRSLNIDAVLLVYSTNSLSNCAQAECTLTILQAVADIQPGATGAALLVGAAGATAITTTVENRCSMIWPAGGRGYAAPILGSCTWAGIPSCCVAVATTTTSTSTSTTTTTSTSTTSTSSTSSSSTTTGPPPCIPSDITVLMMQGLGYDIVVPGASSINLQFLLQLTTPGSTVTIDPSDIAAGYAVTVISGPAAVDNGDGTFTFTFVNGDETVDVRIDWAGTTHAIGDMAYISTCFTSVSGTIHIDSDLPS